MIERTPASEWSAIRRRSLQAFPVALVLLVALSAVVYWEGLHTSEVGFIPGVLVGAFLYWVLLEAMTIVRTGRALRAAAPEIPPSPRGNPR